MRQQSHLSDTLRLHVELSLASLCRTASACSSPTAATIGCWFTTPFPPRTGRSADVYLGQPDEFTDQVTSSTDTFRPDANILESAPNTCVRRWRWPGTERICMSPILRHRVMVFTPESPNVPITGITNAYSLETYGIGTVSLTGTITAGDTDRQLPSRRRALPQRHELHVYGRQLRHTHFDRSKIGELDRRYQRGHPGSGRDCDCEHRVRNAVRRKSDCSNAGAEWQQHRIFGYQRRPRRRQPQPLN